MRRNKLYTVNKWNKSAFLPEENLFKEGGDTWSQLAFKKDPLGSAVMALQGFNPGQAYSQTKNAFGITKAANPFSKGNLKNFMSSAGSNAISAASSAVGGLVGNAISGGLKSGAGSLVSGLGDIASQIPGFDKLSGAFKVVGGGIDAIIGEKVNEQALKEANEGTARLKSTRFTASSTDDLAAQKAAQTSEANVQDDIYEGGLLNDVSNKNEEIERQRLAAQMFADRSFKNAASNLFSNQLNDSLANLTAFGGPLGFGTGALGLMQQNRYFDTIDKRSDALAGKGNNVSMPTGFTGAKTFAGGGDLEAAFLDNFGTDPIGAAMRYRHGLEQKAAEEEMREAEAAREAQYLDMQKRLANLETQNQGLQALIAAQTLPTIPVIPEEAPESSPTPSVAARATSSGNRNWDYIEDQLRKSGKFNDIQIGGIKYNLQRESSIDPTVVGDGGAAFGLGQWHGSRKPKDMSLEGQTQHLIDTLSKFDGKEHWIGRGNYEGFVNARTPEEAHYWIAKGYERPRADIVAKVKRDSDMSLKRMKAFGGELGTNGTDFTNGLLYIDEGGTHEENPMDGVPMGVDAEGIPNLVEEGETVYNNYVFSDRMKVPDFMYKELGLGGIIKKKSKEMSFADASKKLAQESEQRPNDPISIAGLNASLAKLAEVQETERMKQQAEEYMGLEGYACGGKMGRKYKGPGRLTQRLNFGLNSGVGYTPLTDYYDELAAGNAVIQGINDPATMRKINSIKSSSGSTANGSTSGAGQAVPSGRDSNRNYGGRHASNDIRDAIMFKTPEDDYEMPTTPPITQEIRRAALGEYTPEIRPEDAEKIGLMTDYLTGNVKEGYDPYPTWMRYAPAVGAGIMSLTDMLGLTNKPDYTYADKLEAAANRAGYAPNIQYQPIGDYLRYRPMDIWYQQNALNAQARATDRALTNSSSPSKAAGLLASGYNSQLASGNLYRQALEYNDAKRQQIADFNRKTNMFNSQMDLEAAMANARYAQQARQMGLSGLAQAAAMRDAIDQRVGAARSANLNNFLTSLGNIGRENFALNQINDDDAYAYGATTRGTTPHKRRVRGKKNSRWT